MISKEELEEHRIFRNNSIFVTLLFFAIGTYMYTYPFEYNNVRGIECALTIFAFGSIIALIAIINIFTYNKRKNNV